MLNHQSLKPIDFFHSFYFLEEFQKPNSDFSIRYSLIFSEKLFFI